MTDNDQHLRDLQREYLDFLDDEVNIEFFANFISPCGMFIRIFLMFDKLTRRRTKGFTPTRSKR